MKTILSLQTIQKQMVGLRWSSGYQVPTPALGMSSATSAPLTLPAVKCFTYKYIHYLGIGSPGLTVVWMEKISRNFNNTYLMQAKSIK